MTKRQFLEQVAKISPRFNIKRVFYKDLGDGVLSAVVSDERGEWVANAHYHYDKKKRVFCRRQKNF